MTGAEHLVLRGLSEVGLQSRTVRESAMAHEGPQPQEQTGQTAPAASDGEHGSWPQCPRHRQAQESPPPYSLEALYSAA